MKETLQHYRGSPSIKHLLCDIPVFPKKISCDQLQKMQPEYRNIARLIYSLPSACLLCYTDEGEYSYPDEESKRKTLLMYGIHY